MLPDPATSPTRTDVAPGLIPGFTLSFLIVGTLFVLRFSVFVLLGRTGVEGIPCVYPASMVCLSVLCCVGGCPISLLVVLMIVCLSFFEPPSARLDGVPGVSGVIRFYVCFNVSNVL